MYHEYRRSHKTRRQRCFVENNLQSCELGAVDFEEEEEEEEEEERKESKESKEEEELAFYQGRELTFQVLCLRRKSLQTSCQFLDV